MLLKYDFNGDQYSYEPEEDKVKKFLIHKLKSECNYSPEAMPAINLIISELCDNLEVLEQLEDRYEYEAYYWFKEEARREWQDIKDERESVEKDYQAYYIDADKKGLSWKGWKEQYNAQNKNYIATSDAKKIKEILLGISEKCPSIKVVIIDTLNGIMVDDEFNRMKDKGYDKWQDLAYSIYDLISMSNTLREDLTVIFTIHSQTDKDETGYIWTKAKTSGKKLDKIAVESKFTTVLLAKATEGKYVFETRSNNSTTKSPMGAFDEEVIPNDITAVLEALKEF